MSRPVKLVLLWHMHQPPYEDPLLGEFVMPWSLVHGMRDYLDMPALCRELGAPATFNLVPSLLKQMDRYATGKLRDRFLAVTLTPPSQLSDAERAFLVSNFFELRQETMVRPYPRYRELARRALMAGDTEGRWRVFSEADLRDLQVWYFLTWTGETLREDPVVTALLEKGRDFSDQDKRDLQKTVMAFLGRIEPFYREGMAAGEIEVSFSPLYHPILPLLVGTEAAQAADPGCPMPLARFRYPQDAQAQIHLAKAEMSLRMGQPLRGVWPPEGSVSPEVVRMLSLEGVEWIATDSEILARSEGTGMGDGALYRPWKFEGVTCFFRDHRLSDLIGFVYSKWDPHEAAAHFIGELMDIGDRFPEGDAPVVTVALDGENAWEHYDCGGYRFLRIFYETLLASDRVELTTPSRLLDAGQECGTLEKLATGSWINGNFSTWIGDPVKNRAWEILTAARRTLEQWLEDTDPDPETRTRIMDQVYRAEASDWFWWFGEGHSSSFDMEFDQLFRHHVKALYEAMGLEAPPDLDFPLSRPRETTAVLLPSHRIAPALTGRVDNYYKWQGAGLVTLVQGSIHKARPMLTSLRFGWDDHRLYLSLDGPDPLDVALRKGHIIEVHIHEPVHRDIRIFRGAGGDLLVTCGACEVREAGIEVVSDNLIDLSVPEIVFRRDRKRDDSGLAPGTFIELYIRVERDGRELERFPFANNLTFQVRGEDMELENWYV
ncbi:MAG: glycoside hydrolase family 57 protein [Pseudomonadota bacterium]